MSIAAPLPIACTRLVTKMFAGLMSRWTMHFFVCVPAAFSSWRVQALFPPIRLVMAAPSVALPPVRSRVCRRGFAWSTLYPAVPRANRGKLMARFQRGWLRVDSRKNGPEFGLQGRGGQFYG